ncbi:glycogen debranching enzyme isoform X6 [Leptidea sinapis]|nr:glycogen debranching enzyme isoform X2 [Leptidea sinapis]XP_050668417.1 glycogen debranching enzyme isoform X3 [Leptidea sinapis]XP_050668426.1 glycogen debranching enzyme isoform X4 [Leptidea sinapis]XP_050668435.1 glycogen debranching enzyme isoform X5 [Leptidea sinapis]XP_050668443.1 glycogen debranching enzyme isoform X6 [Leptidea sinapis]
MAARRHLNELHVHLARDGYHEVFVDQMDEHVVAVTRHDPVSRKSVIVVAHTCFGAPSATPAPRTLRPLRFEGQLDEILLEASIRHNNHGKTGRPFEPPAEHVPHPRYINGLGEYEVNVRARVPLAESAVFERATGDGRATELHFRGLAPGDVVALRVRPEPATAAALAALAPLTGAPAPDPLRLAPALADLTLSDFNVLLYCCEAEERERCGGGVYDVPGAGPLAYAGLAGAHAALEPLALADDLAHPLCANLRAGDWLPDYTWRRLEDDQRLAPVAALYREALQPLAALPRFLVPCYFELVVRALYTAVRAAALARLGGAARGSRFARELALTSVQLTGVRPSAPLPRAPGAASLSAGLPHFAVGYMRCWGRDTFIALRGAFLLTGREADARAHILAFAASLRHGLIPNLLDGGRNARYNCRDAVWWWLYSIQQYCTEVAGGAALLTEPVSRLFPSDECEAAPPGAAEQPLHDVMQEALDRHFQGVVFRERNAGRQIDAHMTDKGFNVQIGIDPETGFPFGGNDANCGTWMDKMGSSERAGNRGRPATPRDGSAVELVALAYSTAAWLAAEHRAARYPHPGLARRHRDGGVSAWTWPQWAERVRRSFERHFWVPPAPSAADARPDLVHRRAIYKDSHGASQPWADYQLRCNFPVAMAVAPDLFEARHAWAALETAGRLLAGPLGLKTLDPADWNYRGDYDNSDDGVDPSVAHGFNYHQGPEWVWPLGFYLRARLEVARRLGRSQAGAVLAALGPLLREMRGSPWRGLPELTGAGGAYCRDSCRTQAWSSACILEALVDAEKELLARPLTAD